MARKKQKPSSSYPTVNGLVRLAQLSVADDTPEAWDKLCDKVEACLRRGDDALLDRALESLGATDPAAQEELFRLIQDEVTTLHLLAAHAEPGLVLDTEAQLFCIPLVGLAPSGQVPARLEMEALDRIARSFRAHGLVTPEQSVVMVPELLTLHQVYHSPSAMFTLHRALCAQVLSRDEVALPIPANPPSSTSKASDRPTMCLRFLVGTVIGDDPLWFDPDALLEGLFGLEADALSELHERLMNVPVLASPDDDVLREALWPSPDNDEAIPLYDEEEAMDEDEPEVRALKGEIFSLCWRRFTAWHLAISEVLASAFGEEPSTTHASHPARLYDGITEGVHDFQAISARLWLTGLLNKYDCPAEAMVLEVVGTEDGLVLELQRAQGGTLGMHAWPILGNEDLETDLERAVDGVMDLCEELEIGQVVIQEQAVAIH